MARGKDRLFQLNKIVDYYSNYAIINEQRIKKEEYMKYKIKVSFSCNDNNKIYNKLYIGVKGVNFGFIEEEINSFIRKNDNIEGVISIEIKEHNNPSLSIL